MKALVLSGGTGSRLRPITYTSAKQLVPIANKPILFYGLESIAKCGIKDVGVVVGETAKEVMETLEDGSRFGVNISYIRQDRPAGLAHAVFVSREFLGDDDFVMYLGDNFILGGIEEFVEAFRVAQGGVNAQILLAKVEDPHRFGVAVLGEDGSVVRLVEKPEVPPSDLALVGVYIFDKHIHEAVRSIEPSRRGELEITDAIDRLIEDGLSVSSSIVEGYWKDLGEPEALLEGNRLALDLLEGEVCGRVDSSSHIQGRVVIEHGAEVVASVIRGPVVIGAGARIEGSFIGPYTSIGPHCTVRSSEIDYSIVLKDAVVEYVGRLEGSIVGKAAKVTRRESRPSALRLVIGDNSQVELS
ncbi:glucose-1-phosphate thymidylyltransferase [Ferrithrix thermotolerans DSM 19514]|uniref:Glucose-1-phosphate thymidylyltransferase n=1 Tax=Ferrithrix thermotolerans DSM 19514 TaxID=1121881 RepID=A0A1M4V679_9ACTN|nr:glucose-1-phosphate thymidylyltransferase [Ferrithrix thermotolerans]SHE64455.1 glucose-1-phosphate thymidylyltransferase [Ferrithrix thermotolerans DSM 19514]